MSDVGIRPALHALATRADRIGWEELWLALTREQREAALLAYLHEERERGRRQMLAQAIIRGARGYSLTKLLGRPNAELAAAGAALRTCFPHIAEPALVAWLLGTHGVVQRHFFEATGNADRCDANGMAIHDEFGTLDASATRAGCAAVLAADGEVGMVYLLALCTGYADRWAGIREVMLQWAEGVGPVSAAGERAPERIDIITALESSAEAGPEAVLTVPDADIATDAGLTVPAGVAATAGMAADAGTALPNGLVADSPPVGLRLRPVPEPQLTLLDDLLVKTILSAWAGGEHALSRDELQALLDEVVHVSTERRRTNFHLGFADALFGASWRPHLSARSEERRAWYAAGYLTGVARCADSSRVAQCFDGHEDARLLVSRPWPPFEAAADALLPALAQAERFDALAALAPVATLLSLQALRLMADQGRHALERRDPGTALAFLLPAAEGVARRLASLPAGLAAERRGQLERLDLDIRRRLAHAYRLTGAADTAREQLESLLHSEGDPGIRGMILTDLALIGAGLRELAELQVPDDRAHHAELAAHFVDVLPLLDEALAHDPSVAAHAAYVMGVLALLRGGWPEAATQLRVALDAFEARPTVYTGRGLLRNARLYTATAELLALEEPEVARRAAERLRDHVVAGERPPRAFIMELIAHALLVDQGLGESLMDALRERQLVTLDDLAALAGVVEHANVAAAMAAAALDAGRPLSARVDLAYRALPVMVRSGDADRVEALLAVLEDGAADGVATERYLALLDGQRAMWELCWDRVEARWSAIRVYLASGNALRARGCAQDAFFSVVGNAHHRHDWEGEAEDLLEALRRCGGSDGDLAALRAHLPSASASVPPSAFRANARHRILVVGGNEIQARFEEALRESLHAEYGDAIQLACYFTGMTSTWNRQLEDVERILPRVDAVVFSRFIRTTFGRNLRRQLGTRPWRTCGSAGMGRVRALVVELAGELEQRAGGEPVRRGR